MTILEGAPLDSVERSLDEVLGKAGLTTQTTDSRLTLDFSHLDTSRVNAAQRQLLETTASLLLQLQTHDRAVTAVIPSKPGAQQILADSGLMFALVNLNAQLDLFSDPASTDSHRSRRVLNQDSLFEDSPYRRLLRPASWREDFSPHSSDLRSFLLDAIQRSDRNKVDLERILGRAHLGVVGTSFLGLVNPHYLPNADAVAGVTTAASPWLRRIVSRRLGQGDVIVDDVLRILTEAFENVMQHAWASRSDKPRSLITISQTGRGRNVGLRLQILDNGIGIPASLSRGKPERLDTDEACELVQHSFNVEGPFLPFARGFGLPRIRQLVERLNGSLRVTTAGPMHTQIVYTANGGDPGRTSLLSRPVSGTVVAVHLPFLTGTSDRGAAADQ